MLALLCSTVVNTVSAIFAKKGSQNKPITPDAFIPKWAEAADSPDYEPEEQSLEAQKQTILSIAKMFGPKPPKSKTRSLPPKYKGVSK